MGGAVAVAATSAVPPISIGAGALGAMGGVTATVTFSNSIRTVVEEDFLPPPPAPPAPSPKKDERLFPQPNVIIVALMKDGTVSGNGPDPRSGLNGKTADATFSGTVGLQ
jgi:hypothetical protein